MRSFIPGRSLRYVALGLLSFANFASYYLYDSISPVANLLHSQSGFTYAQIGTLNAIYSAPNIVIALFGGMSADRYGAARVCIATAAMCFLGSLLTALSSSFTVMSAGRLLFGFGGEALFVATLVGVGHWFAGKELGLATALYFSVARLGSYLADLSPVYASRLYAGGWRPPLLLAAVISGLGLACVLVYGAMDRKGSTAVRTSGARRFFVTFLRSSTAEFWYMLVMATAFYSVIFPFRSTFAIVYFQNARGMSLQDAGLANSWVFFAAIFASPLFGWIVDCIDHHTEFLVFGTFALTASFLLLGLTDYPLWIATLLVGLSYSMVPAVLWPAITKLVDVRQVGTAFGLMTILQNAGMTLCNVVAGKLDDVFGAGVASPQGYLPMLGFFGVTSFLGFATVLLVWMRKVSARHRPQVER